MKKKKKKKKKKRKEKNNWDYRSVSFNVSFGNFNLSQIVS